MAYPGHPHPEARPSRLAAIAALLGFPAAPPETCSVLELGAGDGAHLIPLAHEQPRARFVGMDLSAKAVERGQARIRELGLPNIRLEQGDIGSFEAAEPFDYVIAHGVYSWVPLDVQTALLALCRRALAPHGLAYISYATYPGCHQREMVRNMMLFHTARLSGAEDVVKEGLRWARFVSQHQSHGEAYGRAIEHELERMERHALGYAFHDDFSEHNTPVYFGQMVESAREQGLDFLAEALFMYFDDGRFSPEVMGMIEQLSGGDRITREQYLDFLRGRAFRQSLFCHAGQVPSGAWQLQKLRDLWVASSLAPQTPQTPAKEAGEVFVSPQGLELRIEQQFVRSAFRLLADVWPSALSVRELTERAALASAVSADDLPRAEQLLLRTLLRAAAARLLELDVVPPPIAAGVSERPLASPLARLEAQSSLLVTDLWHRRLQLEDEASRFLLTALDGQRDHAALARIMAGFFKEHATPSPDTADVERQLELVLDGMRRRALLLA